MYWLSAQNTMLMSAVSVSAVSPFISRCTVCETPSVHMAVHSQDVTNPECPVGWSSLWSGFSFLMVCLIYIKGAVIFDPGYRGGRFLAGV